MLDPALTPGGVVETDVMTVCRKSFAGAHRRLSDGDRERLFARYGLARDAAGFTLDHRVPLALGGANDQANIWPQPRDAAPWNARTKDRLEALVHRRVYSGAMTLAEGQGVFLRDWRAEYLRLIGPPRTLP